VLVVDDEVDARQVAERALASGGAHVETASDADNALRLLTDRTFDVIVCDIAMPGMDGYELVRRIRADDRAPSARTPAIAATAYADDESRQRAVDAGFEGFLAKPFSFEALAAAIHAATRAPRT
jgi:CheY-like chemotaxis protein